MNILSWNSNGLGSRPKFSALKKLVAQNSPTIVLIQETKLESMTPRKLKSLCNSDELDGFFSPSVGSSGGLALLYLKSTFTVENSIINRNWIAILGSITAANFQCAVINIYNPCSVNARRLIWSDLYSLWLLWGVPWVIVGDFNEVLHPSERGSMLASQTGMNDFFNFLQDLNLIEIPGDNIEFTWFRGNKRSKLDRGFINHEILELFPNLKAKALNRGLSDHCPIIYAPHETTCGPKPFRFLNCWLEDDSCLKLIKASWAENSHMTIVQKLKKLKFELKHWNKSVYGNVDQQIFELEATIKNLDKENNLRDLTPLEIRERSMAQLDLWKWSKRKEMLWAQKSRVSWLKCGDRNTKYFHACASSRKRRNTISAIEVDDNHIDSPDVIKQEAVLHFQNLFKEQYSQRPTFPDLSFKKLNNDQIAMLTVAFSHEEIDKAVASCDSNKAPGPDGYNFAFIKAAWSSIKDDFYEVIEKFWRTSKIPKGCNTALIALIPKLDAPRSFKDYRPISMIGCVYKIISKLLALRLQKVVPHLVGPQQSAFMRGRNILDGVLIASEVLETCNRNRDGACLLKLDFNKAFDSVSWSFLHWIHNQMGFPDSWTKWIMSCVTSASASVLINGSPTPPFKLQRGLRQGDPISPLLFDLVIEPLNLLLNSCIDLNFCEGIRIARDGPIVSHLQYADDILIFSTPNKDSLLNLKKALILFELASGLQINFHKSSLIGINLHTQWLENMADELHCKTSQLPFTYLGLPIGGKSTTRVFWEPVIEKLKKKLASWKGNLLSIGGRVTLIRSCLANLPIYFMSLFQIPMCVIHSLVQLQRQFLWGGSEDSRKMALISWDSLQLPHHLGGLNLGNLKIKNRALLFKWIWRFFDSPLEVPLWKQIVAAKYNYNSETSITDLTSPSYGGPWKMICNHLLSNPECKKLMFEGCRRQVGSGNSTLFWHHWWIGEGKLKDQFPRLFRISTSQMAMVSSMGLWNGTNWQWIIDWSRPLRSRDLSDLDALLSVLNQAALAPNSSDTFIWLPHKSGKFSVKSFASELVRSSNSCNESVLKGMWRNLVPFRIEIFAWLAILEKINTRSKLARLGIIQSSEDTCGLCNLHSESCTTLFLHCNLSWLVWSWWMCLWEVPWVCPNSLQSLYSSWSSPFRGKFFGKVWFASFFVILWSLWKERNERIFNNKSSPLSEIQNLILLRLSWWIKGWSVKFPYTPSQVLQNPSCLFWKGVMQKSTMSLIPKELILWSAPPPYSLKWNVDASLRQENATCAIGGVLRDSNGVFLCIFSTPMPSMDINSAEIFAIHRALQISKANETFQDQRIIIESDSMNAVCWCNSTSGGPWNLNFILNYIRSMLLNENIQLVHKGRESNGVADGLAKQGIHRNSDFVAWL